MAAPVLDVKGLQAAYGKVQVLWDVTLRVNEGEFVALIGANGAGKTTTLRAVSGVVPPRHGSIALFGHPAVGHSPESLVRLGLGHVPENRQLFPAMSVQDNLELGAAPRDDAWRARMDTLKTVFRLFPRLEERKTQMAGTLSGGEQQMTAVGRALMGLPRLLLVDEPSLGLSPKVTQDVFHALKDVNRAGVTVLLVEQNVRQSLLLADRAYVLDHGTITQEGPARELLNDPKVQEAYLAF